MAERTRDFDEAQVEYGSAAPYSASPHGCRTIVVIQMPNRKSPKHNVRILGESGRIPAPPIPESQPVAVSGIYHIPEMCYGVFVRTPSLKNPKTLKGE